MILGNCYLLIDLNFTINGQPMSNSYYRNSTY